MNKYVIQGGTPLSGTVTISGAKNAAVAILPAALLVNGTCRIENVPNISDVCLLVEILRDMGAKISYLNANTLDIDCTHVRDVESSDELVRRIRASYYLIGAQLGRFGHARVALPGGCNFGARPIDQHIKGFEALGATVDLNNGFVCAYAPENGLRGGRVNLDVVSVGATMNIMIGAVLAEGTTIIENAAKEPHIVDLANFLNAMGAKVSGAGTDHIKVRGVRALRGGSYSIIPDQIEAGTYMVAVAAVGGNVLVRNVIPKHMDCISAKLREMGAKVTEYDDAIRVQRTGLLRRANVKTMPYPGFPTDMQPQIAVCMALASGVSFIRESIYDTRFGYCAELNRMGASIKVETKTAVISGVAKLQGCAVRACDLRAGAAMVIAGLAAEGETVVEDVEYIERGYEDIIHKISGMGGSIRRMETAAELSIPAAV
ncbi:MAG: UDP-N-acetylglucosamine 1-carboxyvinyltransferase [Oscillospiraceae bacterium]|jgi:UDP-N-acetylglucosamine 1-carboxyvinyltransferase|nr:UDP-N-acetylglucosamine 1-carboxyvinyltransferase [Oscillospiraceae bacterium]